MSDFCRHHGFYAPCPSCTGEEVIWEIPVIDGNGVQIDVFRLSEGHFEDAMDVPWGGGSIATVAPPGTRIYTASKPEPVPLRSSGMPPALDHVPLPVNPSLYAKVRLLLQK